VDLCFGLVTKFFLAEDDDPTVTTVAGGDASFAHHEDDEKDLAQPFSLVPDFCSDGTDDTTSLERWQFFIAGAVISIALIVLVLLINTPLVERITGHWIVRSETRRIQSCRCWNERRKKRTTKRASDNDVRSIYCTIALYKYVLG